MTRLMPVAAALCGAVFTVSVCLALGSLLLRRLRLEFHRLEFALFSFVSGSACLSLAVFFLCVVHQARLASFLPAGAVVILLAVRQSRRDSPRKALPDVPKPWLVLFSITFALFFACYFSNALAPEISPDGSGYHLGNVARCWRNAGFDWSFHSIYASLSQGMEMLFLVAFSIGRHSAAAMVHLAFQAALPLLLLCYGRRFGFPRTGAFAGLLVYACPVVGITGASAYNDVAVATLVFAGFYLLQVKQEINYYNLLFIIGLLAGFSYAVKFTAGLALPLALLLTKGKRALPIMIGAAVMAGPWLIRNWIWLGNPFAPFLNSIFPNPYWTSGAEHQYLADLGRYPIFKSYGDFIMQLTVLGGLVPGMIGPAFLLLPLCLLALRHAQGGKLLLAGLVYAVPACFNTEIRFFIPAIPFFSLALGLAIESSWGALPAVALLQTVLCWPAVMDTYCDRNAWRIRGFQFRAALLAEPETEYIGSHVGDYALTPAIEHAVPPNAHIFSFAGRAAGYIDRDVIIGYESTSGERIQQVLQNAAAAEAGQRAAALEAKSEGLEFLLVNDSDVAAKDMRDHMSNWGLSKLAEANGTTLYRID